MKQFISCGAVAEIVGIPRSTLTRWVRGGNSADVARKHYLQTTPEAISKAAKMVVEKSTPDSPQHVGERGSRNRDFPVLTSTETQGIVTQHTREDSKESADSKGKRLVRDSEFSNSFQTESEQRLLGLFRQLPQQDQQQLIEELEAQHRQRQHNLETAGD